MNNSFTIRLKVEINGIELFERELREPDAVVIGRAQDCGIVIGSKEAGLSRHHCILDINPPILTVEDLGSTNGTILNGADISDSPVPTPLRSEDQLILANASISVETIGFDPAPSTARRPEPTSTRGQPASAPPDEIKEYRILKRIGAGSGGEVYLATAPGTGEKVALKTMTPELEIDVEHKARFIRESDTMRELAHPNIVRMIDAGYAAGMFFIAMEYCDGGDLDSVLNHYGGSLRIDKATTIILDVLAALEYLHTRKIPNDSGREVRGIVHRDIKPANILLRKTKDGNVVKLGDFGLAKAMVDAGVRGITRTGCAGGTMAFACRQQILNYKHARPEVDVWSCAAVFYYLLTGSPSRDMGSVKNPMAAVLETKPIPLARRLPEAPPTLTALLDSALDDSSELRFKSAAEFADALKNLALV
ncbi:MAG: protein kinase [Kiritimatiellaeota bacterium]|nr:protein kinase [Kiritimatiellota bacterium]